MTSTAELNQQRKAVLPNGLGVMCDFFVEKARNAELWTTEGKRYIDFAGGIGVLNTGHLHPKVQKAVAEQLEQFSHTCYQVIPYALYGKVAERIAKAAPVGGNAKTFFVTTGAEAVENAIKIARAKTGRRAVIAFQGAFHGRTNFTLGLTGKVAPYKLNFGPFPGDIYHIPFPNKLHNISEEESLNALHKLLKVDVAPSDVAAIIIEPVQGEGGFNVAPFSFLKELRKLCDEHGITLIFDEVQSGFARTGKLFATEHTGVAPDLITLAKSLAGGFPLSAVVGKAEFMDAPLPGGLGGTYAGNPLALAAADAVMDVIEEEKLNERATVLGDKVKAKFEQLKADIPQIADIRGLGGMVAVEFMNNGQPDADLPKKAQAIALENGLIILTTGMYYNVIRFLFPLTIEDQVFEEAMGILENALRQAAKA
ncbi:4-aminobutyrate--2-oxoglutarate transaminase [Neisseria shayeganii]|uniref:4-aminobutyrate--2-oxoglutarate transaminase n=1 Tax=Neisseria shayeganii TaxID=607712 RepID=A0A7D7RLW9_9NEIS|nr:4-aminobutyrate--2-oxoglutarate transaminase [Neisseria shayeganii]QMT39742.1 4-aminobutyrate--2-oxoglutarate transaminase [Neisseria shayeganii]